MMDTDYVRVLTLKPFLGAIDAAVVDDDNLIKSGGIVYYLG